MSQEKKYEPYELLNQHFRVFVDSEKKKNNIVLQDIIQIHKLRNNKYQLLDIYLNDWSYGDNMMVTIHSDRDIYRLNTGKSGKTLDEYLCALYPCKYIGIADTEEIRIIELMFTKKEWENIPGLTDAELNNILDQTKNILDLYVNAMRIRLTP